MYDFDLETIEDRQEYNQEVINYLYENDSFIIITDYLLKNNYEIEDIHYYNMLDDYELIEDWDLEEKQDERARSYFDEVVLNEIPSSYHTYIDEEKFVDHFKCYMDTWGEFGIKAELWDGETCFYLIKN